MEPLDSCGKMLLEIEADQVRLWGFVATVDAATSERPRTERWSIVENLRHLLCAEQMHLGQFVPGNVRYSPLGLPPPGLRSRSEFSGLDEAATPTVQKVIEEWREAHAAMRPHLMGDGEELRRALWKNRRHLRNHVAEIERLVRRAKKRRIDL